MNNVKTQYISPFPPLTIHKLQIVSTCFLWWDPEAKLNKNAEVVDIPQNKISPQQQSLTIQPKEGDLKKVKACLDYIEKMQINMANGYQD